MNKERIRAKAILGLPLTAKEKAVYLLFIASTAAAKEVEESFISDRDWCYRAWNGEMYAILKAQEEIRKLPDIQ